MTVERVFPSGAIRISELVTDGGPAWLESRMFYGYSQREARRLFRQHLAERNLTTTNR